MSKKHIIQGLAGLVVVLIAVVLIAAGGIFYKQKHGQEARLFSLYKSTLLHIFSRIPPTSIGFYLVNFMVKLTKPGN